MTDHEDVEIRYVPRADGAEKMVLCPECGERLPVAEVTECSDCGAWLTLRWRIDAPSQYMDSNDEH